MINPMYQFSLDWYKELFQKSINESKEIQSQDRNDVIMKIHKLNVYNQACRSLFERHKLLLALQMYVKLQLSEGKINFKEYDFFLRGGTIMDPKLRPPKPPQDWLTDQAWDNITELERLLPETFSGLPAAVTLNFKEWHHWFSSDKPMPEDAQLPGEWETKCDEPLKKMIVLRCFRPDRVIFAIRNFVAVGMKSSEFIMSKPTSISEVYEESTPTLPVIFVLSTGTDPTDTLMRFAAEKDATVSTLSLGKGQGEECKKILTKCSETGNWCFLSNCHLSISLLPELESIMDQLFKKKQKQTFRLFMTASPHDEFPISLLQRSLKIA
jgi:dynein heavy chain